MVNEALAAGARISDFQLDSSKLQAKPENLNLQRSTSGVGIVVKDKNLIVAESEDPFSATFDALLLPRSAENVSWKFFEQVSSLDNQLRSDEATLYELRTMKEPFCGARCYLTSLMAVEIILAVIVIIVTSIYYHLLSQYIAPADQRILFGQLFNFYIFSFQVIVLYIASLILWHRLWRLPYTRDIHLFINLWLFVTTLILLCGFGTVWSVSACIDEMEAAAETAMLNGIDNYYSCPDWKLHWDELQFYRQCCGVNSYIDWKQASWMSEMVEMSEMPSSLTCATAGTSTVYAPYACCRRNCLQCYENFIPNVQHIGSLNISFINTAGCLPLFTQNLWRLVYIVLGMIMVMLKLQAFICVLVRFVMNRQCPPCGERVDVAQYFRPVNCDLRPKRSYLDLEDPQKVDAEAQTPMQSCRHCGGSLDVPVLERYRRQRHDCCHCQVACEPEVIH